MIVLVTATVTRNAVVAMAARVRRTLRWRGFGKESAGVGSGSGRSSRAAGSVTTAGLYLGRVPPTGGQGRGS